MIVESFDGTPIHIVEMGEGPAVVLVHGLFSSAHINWVKFGTARRLADAGFRLLMPDLRGHGQSGVSEPWPDDALARDIEALVSHFQLSDYILGGFSLGARTTMRAVACGLTPRAVILGGMGLEGVVKAFDRSDWFIRLIEGRGNWKRGDPQYLAAAFMEQNVQQPERLIPMLHQLEPVPEDTLSGLHIPALVVTGEDDQDNGNPQSLADMLPCGEYRPVPGTHMSSVTKPEFGDTIAGFLQQHQPAVSG